MVPKHFVSAAAIVFNEHNDILLINWWCHGNE